jgi:type IV pilus assembly protein PilB
VGGEPVRPDRPQSELPVGRHAGAPDSGDRQRILGDLLLARKLVDEEGLEQAVERQRKTGVRLGRALLDLGLLDEEALFRTLAFQLGLPFRAPPLEPEPQACRRVRAAFALRRGVLPLKVEGRIVEVAMIDPLDLPTLDDLQFQCGGPVRPVVSTPEGIRRALERSYPSAADVTGEDELPGVSDGRPEVRVGEGGAVPRLLDDLLRRAVREGASDLHVEPTGRGIRVRCRVDGILRELPDHRSVSGTAFLSRIKVVAGMDIAVRLRPQDGGFTFRDRNRSFAVRVSTLPVEAGEKAVLRLLASDDAPSGLPELGLMGTPLRQIRRILASDGGVLLAAGPTGSGKSSTLSAAVAELDREERNVVSLEDPVEYRLPGVSQVQMRPRAGLTFPSALRAVLRQDPDVVLVGEIRDRETAEIAMAAAVTGHLVLSTIHTIDAPSGIARLLHMGVPRYLVAGGLAGIVAQRLVRRTCSGCRGDPQGCPRCPDGYRGRIGVYQVLTVTEALREEIVRGSSAAVLRRRAQAAGMGSMEEDARRKVAESLTSSHEVARVLRETPGEAFPCSRCRQAIPPEAMGCPFCGHPSESRCRCTRTLRADWRFCPDCLRPAPPSPKERGFMDLSEALGDHPFFH